jgi:hypothetical protein
MGNPARAKPAATLIPVAASELKLAVLHAAPVACARVSWLPLGGTGRSPATVKAVDAVGEGAGRPVAVDAVGDGAGCLVPVDAPVDTAEQADSAATTHHDAAEMTAFFTRIQQARRMAR